MQEDGRKRPLTVIGQKIQQLVAAQFDAGYKGFLEKIKYPIKFIDAENGKKAVVKSFILEFARTSHLAENLAVKVFSDRKTACYSGDGSITPEAAKLFSGTDLLIQETKFIDKDTDGHASMSSALDFALKNNVKKLAFVHLDRHARKEKKRIFELMKNQTIRIILPEPMDVVEA